MRIFNRSSLLDNTGYHPYKTISLSEIIDNVLLVNNTAIVGRIDASRFGVNNTVVVAMNSDRNTILFVLNESLVIPSDYRVAYKAQNGLTHYIYINQELHN